MSCCLDLHPIYEHEHATFEWCQILHLIITVAMCICTPEIGSYKNKPTKVE
jgi:hypothetical protein